MGSAAGDDLNRPGVIEMAEPFDDVSTELIIVVQRLFVEPFPVIGHAQGLSVALASKVFSVFAGCSYLAQQVLGKFFFEDRVRKLLQENGREVHIGLERKILLLQFTE